MTDTEAQIPGDHSTVRFPAGISFKFLMRVPAGSVPQFFEMDTEQGRRVFPLDKIGDHKFALSRQRARYAAVIHFDSSATEGGFLALTPKEPLRPGEYCLGYGKADGACFGVDGPVGAASVAPSGLAGPAVSLASVTEPAALNVVYYVDPTGNEVPLEYDVPFRAGLTSILETRREQAFVRFPQGSSFRFVLRIPAGKSADFMQVDPDRGWRTIPIGWAGKSKGAVMSGGKAARMVPVDTATVGAGTTLITPRDPLVPGEYCINLHSEEWFCFGVDPGGAVDAPGSAAASGGGSAMSNADVIKLASAGLSGDIIANAIRQAASQNFDLSLDGLIALKKAGVPDAAVSAMQQFKSTTTTSGTPSGPAHVPDSKIPVPPDVSAFYAVDGRGKLVRLEASKADLVDARSTVTEGGQVYYKLFGAKSPVRFTDGTVSIVIKLPPKGHGFLASMDNDNQFGDLYDMQVRRWEPTNGVREARFNTRKQHPGRDFTPDPGTFEFATIKIGESFYKVVPVEPLVPGEYCVGLHSLPTEYERLYCFGIDSPR